MSVVPFDVPRSALQSLPPSTACRSDVLVVGGGAAGLTAALAAAAAGAEVLLLARAAAATNSAWAQGGIAAALAADDCPADHAADTVIAGAGLCDAAAVQVLTDAAPAWMQRLADAGVPFARRADGSFALGLEGGHGRRRIVYVGDRTGSAVVEVLLQLVRAEPRIRILPDSQALELLTADEQVVGALVQTAAGALSVTAAAVVLAGGGAGALYGLSSNQSTALGETIALALRAGATVADMEFVQFHPTVYRTRSGAGFLISEAVRGEGGVLQTVQGERFMPAYDPRAELAPRDVVTRGIYAALRRSGSPHVLLDMRGLSSAQIAEHFPTILARLLADGLDPRSTPIPVAPAAHYLMGGILTDLDGVTSLPGLFAAGETACSGVHGANRLASNSLLECLVFGERAGRAAAARAALFQPYGDDRGEWQLAADAAPAAADWRSALAALMQQYGGPLRSGAELQAALRELERWPRSAAPGDADGLTMVNAVQTARLILSGALQREESRGGHFRHDFPTEREELRRRLHQQRAAAVPAAD
jgi:L-aspartate oxidase